MRIDITKIWLCRNEPTAASDWPEAQRKLRKVAVLGVKLC
jgi:hypothetical protein